MRSTEPLVARRSTGSRPDAARPIVTPLFTASRVDAAAKIPANHLAIGARQHDLPFDVGDRHIPVDGSHPCPRRGRHRDVIIHCDVDADDDPGQPLCLEHDLVRRHIFANLDARKNFARRRIARGPRDTFRTNVDGRLRCHPELDRSVGADDLELAGWRERVTSRPLVSGAPGQRCLATPLAARRPRRSPRNRRELLDGWTGAS